MRAWYRPWLQLVMITLHLPGKSIKYSQVITSTCQYSTKYSVMLKGDSELYRKWFYITAVKSWTQFFFNMSLQSHQSLECTGTVNVLKIGLTNGEDCLCFDAVPFTNVLLASNEAEVCSSKCAGNSNYLCGGSNALSIYVASKWFFMQGLIITFQ